MSTSARRMCDHCGCRSYPEIAELTDDHQRILELAWRVAEARRGGGDVDADQRALSALLDAHVSREEEGLYPLLADSGDLTADVREALEQEHQDVDSAIAADRFDRRTYYALAAHIEHEEMELFPAAMFSFDNEQWRTLGVVHRVHPLRALGVPTPSARVDAASVPRAAPQRLSARRPASR